MDHLLAKKWPKILIVQECSKNNVCISATQFFEHFPETGSASEPYRTCGTAFRLCGNSYVASFFGVPLSPGTNLFYCAFHFARKLSFSWGHLRKGKAFGSCRNAALSVNLVAVMEGILSHYSAWPFLMPLQNSPDRDSPAVDPTQTPTCTKA